MGGGSEYAPRALLDLFGLIKDRIPAAQLGGVLGDRSHVYGYHRARNVLPGNDYSVVETLDREGDGWAASALDVTPGSGELMHTVSRRLLNAKHDPRMKPVREFFGSTDGRTVCGWDWSSDGPTTSDDMSHLWHVHLSVHRKYANDLDALRGVAEVLAGDGDELSASEVAQIIKAINGVPHDVWAFNNGGHGRPTAWHLQNAAGRPLDPAAVAKAIVADLPAGGADEAVVEKAVRKVLDGATINAGS